MKAKPLDTHNMQVIWRGLDWEHPLPPSSKKVSHLLERNESVITWMQPEGGKIEDQIPCIRYKSEFYGLSLRMQKSVWRHIRLRKDYVNSEPVSHTMRKLKIPLALLREKKRTQLRFNNMKKANASKAVACGEKGLDDAEACVDGARQAHQSRGGAMHRNAVAVRKAVDNILGALYNLPPLTVFTASSVGGEECVESVLMEAVRSIESRFPGITSNKEFFMGNVESAFERHQQACTGRV